jgi:protein-disulfide isomerase
MRGSDASSPVAAELEGERITEAELDARVKDRLWMKETRGGDASLVYELRDAELRSWIEERALAREAEKRGLTVEALLAAESAARGPVSDAEVAAFQEAHKHEIPPGIPPAELASQIRMHLQGERDTEVRQALTSKAQVAVHLQAPRVNVSGNGPSLGPADAPVTLVEFADFQCPYCARALPLVSELRERFPTQVRVVFKHLPLESIHPRARAASEAAICAEKQDRFWPYHDLLFQNPRALGDADLRAHAGTVGLDLAAFDACLQGPERTERIAADVAEATAAGISGTPAFVLNGVLIRGLRSPDEMAALVERELAAAAKTP